MALEVGSAERKDCVERECAGDEAMRDEVASLLAAHSAAGDFIETPPSESLQVVERLMGELPYERLGPYRLLERIGTGGMGQVYRAIRDDGEFHRQAAVKVVRRGMDSELILRRFRQERQILAGLHHANITVLLDGGATPDGSPYFVMEYVEGMPISGYCEERGLRLAERLRLFRTVCDAVHYAHKNHVIHRDLKPSNILVTQEGVPKLLDFGIARVFEEGDGSENAETTLSTRGLMTPEYASPEQIRGEKVTPASDIYSLGVVLYELLTRRRPYRVDPATPQKIAIAVCEQEPEKPSIAAARPGDSAAKDYPNRAAGETGLARRLRGDLDNIVLMALRKEPQRRYKSAEQFSEDVRRYLEGLPVEARRGARTDRAIKYGRRHRAAVLSAMMALLAALAVWATLPRLLIPAAAPMLSTGGRPSANTEANEYFEKAQITYLGNWNPLRIMDLLEKALEKDPQFAAARAEYGFYHLIMIDGGLSDDVSWMEKAEQHLMKAIRDDPSCLRALSSMAAVSFYRRRPDDVFRYAAAADQVSPGDENSRVWLINQYNLSGDYASAKRLAYEALRRNPFHYPARMNLASMLEEEGDLEGAVRESVKVLEQNPLIVNCIQTLAMTHLDAGNLDKAREVLQSVRPEDRENLQLRLGLALLQALEGRAAEAHRTMNDRVQRWAGLVPFATVWAAQVYSVLGDRDAAFEWLEKAIVNGDRRFAWMRRTPHLVALREDPRFDRALKQHPP
jgi:serine/threonine protein kinase/Flp pilus assembly protein TadD